MEEFMSIPKVAAIIALVGLVGLAGLVTSSTVHASLWDNFIFNVSAVCLVLALLIFLSWFIIEACKEIASDAKQW